MALNDVFKVTLDFTYTGSTNGMSTGFYVQQDSTTGFDIADIGDAVKDWWNTELGGSGLTTGMKELYASSVALNAVSMRKINPPSAIIDLYTTGLPIAGTDAAGTALPKQAAVLVSLRTALSGRSYRGRMYLPPISEADYAEDISAATANKIADQTADLLANAIEGAAYDISAVVWSPTLDEANVITQVNVDRNMRTQRRRQGRTPVYVQSPV